VLRPTRAGWSFFVLTFSVGFAALNTGNNLLYLVLSLMLSFLVLSGVLSESALRGIRIERSLPRALYAGARNRVVVRISNEQRRISAFAIVVEDLSDAEATRDEPLGRVFALRVVARGSETRSYLFSPERRGWHDWTGIRVSTRFPFGLFAKSRLIEAPARALVYPEIRPLAVVARGRANQQEAASARVKRGQGVEVSGLREFVAGDPARRISWKRSLKRGRLLVSEVDESVTGDVEVRLRTAHNRDGADAQVDAAFEARVTRAASECDAHLEAGLRVSLRTDSTRLAPGSGSAHRAVLLRFLALVESEQAPEGEALEDTSTSRQMAS